MTLGQLNNTGRAAHGPVFYFVLTKLRAATPAVETDPLARERPVAWR